MMLEFTRHGQWLFASALAIALLGCPRTEEIPSPAADAQPTPASATTSAPRTTPTVFEMSGVDVGAPSAGPQRPNKYLCTHCGRTFQVADAHLVPVPDPGKHRYLPILRCNDCWKATLAESREYFRAHADATEMAALLVFLAGAGASQDDIKKFATGKSPLDDGLALFDAMDRGDLVLKPR